ncbi:class I SAM-dependent methyltransferase [Nocardia uniformis]|uniref:Class I SAM-dependent methyltransferase n=1 Tax=Nocardia uniformis TaxID=53432 RepID=A0A849C140_9NOCA|nr:class I SAM-dependent methyltransferase [Nocardia uniformis]NNH72473.1 class I SAM-dependent methyltransferase [Nocardia uniformis]
MIGKDALRAAKPYTPTFLALYDPWVIRLSNRSAWRCPAEIMLAAYNKHLGHRHLEVGPGSGWYLVNAQRPAESLITLMDLNPAPLSHTRKRLHSKGCQVRTVTGNVLDPVPDSAGTGFDSIGLNFVMHCVPGSFAQKGVAFTHLARVLADDGTLFGATILNQRPRTLFGRALSATYTRAGAFNNADDNCTGLESTLRAAFAYVELTDVGDVTMFTTRYPIR